MPLVSTRTDGFEIDGPFIRPLYTDSNPEKPFVLTNTDREPDAKGNFEFDAQEVDSPSVKHWQLILGDFVAHNFLNLDKRLQWQALLPKGYVLYTHWKSSKDDPKDLRGDQYLECGRKGLRFRSPNEFIPHFCWLLEKGPERPGYKCLCRYCRPGKPSQGEVNAELGISSDKHSAVSKPPPKRMIIRKGTNALYTVVV